MDGSIAEIREAIRISPNYAKAHCNLGLALDPLGDMAVPDARIAPQTMISSLTGVNLRTRFAHDNLRRIVRVTVCRLHCNEPVDSLQSDGCQSWGLKRATETGSFSPWRTP